MVTRQVIALRKWNKVIKHGRLVHLKVVVVRMRVHVTCSINIHRRMRLKNISLHSETSDSVGSGSVKASFVSVTELALERGSMAECIMGSQMSSMFGITNIFCWTAETKKGERIEVLSKTIYKTQV